jgi:hypothetical protein
MKFILILIFLIPFHVNAQNDFNIPDSLVRNSAAFYTNWVSIYHKMKDNKSFQIKMESNKTLKNEFDSATYLRKQYSKAIKFTALASFVPITVYFISGKQMDPIPSNILAITPILPTLLHFADRRNRRFLTSEFVKHVIKASQLSGIETKYYNWEVKNFHTLDYIKFHENELYIRNKFKYEFAEEKNSVTVEEKVEKLLNFKKNGIISEKEFKRQMKSILNKKE